MSEFQAVEDVVALYFRALHEGDVSQVQQLFIPGAEIRGYYEGELVNMKLPEYLNVLRRMSPPVRIGEDFDMRICGIDQIGNIASVRTRYLFEALYYVDYLSLLKIKDEWKIVNKVFHHD